MRVLITNRQKIIKLDTRYIRKFILRLMKTLALTDCELSVTFVDNQMMQQINRTYLKRDKATNVISFSLSEGEFGNINPGILGDIVISVEQAAEDALTGGLGFQEEVDYLLIHGLLHLTGYDHENTSVSVAEKMSDKEKELFLCLRGINLE